MKNLYVQYLSYAVAVALLLVVVPAVSQGQGMGDSAGVVSTSFPPLLSDVRSTSTLATTTVPAMEPVLTVFHSPTCPHCRKEMAFLDRMQVKYPDLEIRRYIADDSKNHALMRELAVKYGAEKSLGLVPLTFVGGQYFSGFQDDETSGATIETAIRTALGSDSGAQGNSNLSLIAVPLIGTVNPADFSLPALAALLGFLDGFNVCSLGALVLIIGLALKLQRRKAIVLFGGTFILVTALVYSGLIVLWYHIFDIFSAYMDVMKIGVALLSLGGGMYFIKEYVRMRKQGAVCELSESSFITRLTTHTGKVLEDSTHLFTILGTVFLFAAVLAIVEFPCSAAVPVVFAGMLVDVGLSNLAYLSHIALYILFYMLDEIIVFGIAAYKLKLWMANGAFTKWAVLGEAVILLAIGLYYAGVLMGII